MKLGPETIDQMKFFDWIHSRPDLDPYCFHIGNQRKCTPQQGRILKRMGVKSGASDIFVGIPKGGWNGMFLELKSGSGKPTNNQERFMIDMTSMGYYCVWASGYEQARKVIEKYIGQ